MRAAAGTVPALLLVAMGLTAPAGGQVRTRADIETAVSAWTADVHAHQAGTIDAPARAIANWPWARISPVLERVERSASPETILRAATVYLDIAVHVPRELRPIYPTDGKVINTLDGRAMHAGQLDTQVWWARHMVNALLQRSDDPGHSARIRDWYQQIAQLFAGRLNYADQQWHLEAALLRFPNDPVLLLDRGCLDEALAGPLVQQVTHAELSAGLGLPGNSAPGTARLKFPRLSVEGHRREAEKYYTRSIASRASGEAHVRLGWLLLQRRRPREALAHLQAALDDPDAAVRYYARLFLGHARTAEGSVAAAIESFSAALELFPDAQAPHLGISRVHMREGNAAAAAAALHGITGDMPSHENADPYWTYHWCRGRDVADLPADGQRSPIRR
jgi:tetratricopeptide (TPR) repeat protein